MSPLRLSLERRRHHVPGYPRARVPGVPDCRFLTSFRAGSLLVPLKIKLKGHLALEPPVLQLRIYHGCRDLMPEFHCNFNPLKGVALDLKIVPYGPQTLTLQPPRLSLQSNARKRVVRAKWHIHQASSEDFTAILPFTEQRL
jgi:hypothetical protein